MRITERTIALELCALFVTKKVRIAVPNNTGKEALCRSLWQILRQDFFRVLNLSSETLPVVCGHSAFRWK